MEDDELVELPCYVVPFEGDLLATYRDMKAYIRYADGMIVLHDRRTNECFELNDLDDLDGFMDDRTCDVVKVAIRKLPVDHLLDKRYRVIDPMRVIHS